jgi:Anti-sigma factor NepR
MNVIAKIQAETAKRAAQSGIVRTLKAEYDVVVREELPDSFFNLLRRLEDAERAARITARYSVAH